MSDFNNTHTKLQEDSDPQNFLLQFDRQEHDLPSDPDKEEFFYDYKLLPEMYPQYMLEYNYSSHPEKREIESQLKQDEQDPSKNYSFIKGLYLDNPSSFSDIFSYQQQALKLQPEDEFNPVLSAKVGPLTLQERRAKIDRYLKKKSRRVFQKRVSYNCRKRVADQRIRIKGRFVTKEEALKLLQLPNESLISQEDIKERLQARGLKRRGQQQKQQRKSQEGQSP